MLSIVNFPWTWNHWPITNWYSWQHCTNIALPDVWELYFLSSLFSFRVWWTIFSWCQSVLASTFSKVRNFTGARTLQTKEQKNGLRKCKCRVLKVNFVFKNWLTIPLGVPLKHLTPSPFSLDDCDRRSCRFLFQSSYPLTSL